VDEDGDEAPGRNDPNPRDFEALDTIKELEQKGVPELLEMAHKAMLVDLMAKLKMGQISHQEAAILRNMLRDNGMVLGLQPPGQREADLARPPLDLPKMPDPDDYDE
jgi:hypothetical protein